jgi:uncharacterized protein YybS (DUF2232 family)
MPTNYGPVILGVSVTVLIAVVALFFRAGHLAARVEELERWRANIRQDMHEVSDMLEQLGRKIENLDTLIRERTGRRLPAQGEG